MISINFMCSKEFKNKIIKTYGMNNNSKINFNNHHYKITLIPVSNQFSDVMCDNGILWIGMRGDDNKIFECDFPTSTELTIPKLLKLVDDSRKVVNENSQSTIYSPRNKKIFNLIEYFKREQMCKMSITGEILMPIQMTDQERMNALLSIQEDRALSEKHRKELLDLQNQMDKDKQKNLEDEKIKTTKLFKILEGTLRMYEDADEKKIDKMKIAQMKRMVNMKSRIINFDREKLQKTKAKARVSNLTFHDKMNSFITRIRRIKREQSDLVRGIHMMKELKERRMMEIRKKFESKIKKLANVVIHEMNKHKTNKIIKYNNRRPIFYNGQSAGLYESQFGMMGLPRFSVKHIESTNEIPLFCFRVDVNLLRESFRSKDPRIIYKNCLKMKQVDRMKYLDRDDG
jgi:hypothetical protein